VWRDEGRPIRRLFHLNIRWLIRKDAGESGPRNSPRALFKEQNHNFAETIHGQQVDCQIFSGDFLYV